MTKKEENSFSMYRVVNSVLADNRAVVDSVPVFREAADEFAGIIGEIEETNNKFLHLTAGTAEMKGEAMRDLIELLISMSSSLVVYADLTGREDIRAKGSVTKRMLVRLRDTDLIGKGRMILGMLQEYSGALVEFGITPERIEDLRAGIERYDKAAGRQGTEYAEKSGARKKLTGLFEKSRLFLSNRLDRCVEMVRGDNHEFYEEYRAARVIKDLRGRG